MLYYSFDFVLLHLGLLIAAWFFAIKAYIKMEETTAVWALYSNVSIALCGISLYVRVMLIHYYFGVNAWRSLMESMDIQFISAAFFFFPLLFTNLLAWLVRFFTWMEHRKKTQVET